MIMTDEFKPIIRDPHKSANMLEQPVAPVPVPQPPSDPIEQVLSPREVSEGLAKADPLTRHPRVSSIMLSVVFGLLLLAAAVGVWWLGVRTMEGQSYEDMVWSKFDAALPGWLEPVVHVFTISTVGNRNKRDYVDNRPRRTYRKKTMAVDCSTGGIRRNLLCRSRVAEAAAATSVLNQSGIKSQ